MNTEQNDIFLYCLKDYEKHFYDKVINDGFFLKI